MKNYYKIMLGKKSMHAEDCFKGNFIGADYGLHVDLSSKLYEDWRDFNKEMIPAYLQSHPNKTRIGAGLACGALWTVAKGLEMGDIVLCPNGHGEFLVGEISGQYEYKQGEILPHRRAVHWLKTKIKRSEVSDALRSSTTSQGTSVKITQHADEIERFIHGNNTAISVADPTVEDPTVFALEKHLEEFLVANWTQTELGKKYDIYQDEDGELSGQQYQTDTGYIDILAISKDKKEILVVELKKGRASDAVVGQIQRYMGFIKEDRAEKNQTVKGIIIALEDDAKIRRALSVTTNIEFYRYEVSFKLFKN